MARTRAAPNSHRKFCKRTFKHALSQAIYRRLTTIYNIRLMVRCVENGNTIRSRSSIAVPLKVNILSESIFRMGQNAVVMYSRRFLMNRTEPGHLVSEIKFIGNKNKRRPSRLLSLFKRNAFYMQISHLTNNKLMNIRCTITQSEIEITSSNNSNRVTVIRNVDVHCWKSIRFSGGNECIGQLDNSIGLNSINLV